MNDEQRKHWVQMLGPINDQAAANKVEADFKAVKKQLQDFIKLRCLHPKDLPSYKIQKVVMGNYDCITIITDTFHYVQVSIESDDYGDSVRLNTCDNPDIEDAHEMGILSQEQYDKYKKAQQVYLGQRRKINARSRIKRLVLDVGANNVQEYLDKLNQ